MNRICIAIFACATAFAASSSAHAQDTRDPADDAEVTVGESRGALAPGRTVEGSGQGEAASEGRIRGGGDRDCIPCDSRSERARERRTGLCCVD